MKKWPFDPKNLTKIVFLGSNALFFHELHPLLFLWVDLILNFDYSKPSWTIFDLFGTRVEHSFAPLWTILSGFQSLHIILGTNLDFFFTSPIGTLAHHELFWPIFIIFGVKCPFFHGWHPLFFLSIASLHDFVHPLKKNMDVVGEKIAIWPQKPS